MHQGLCWRLRYLALAITKSAIEKKMTAAASAEQKTKYPRTKKGQARRERIKEVATSLLVDNSYYELTLEQITSGAGIPTSVFYHYFQNKRELVLELLDELFADFKQSVISSGPYGAFEQGVRVSTAALLHLYADNFSLVRCLAEVNEPEFAARWRNNLFSWRQQVAEALVEFCDAEGDYASEFAAIAHSVSILSESVAYELYVLKNEALLKRLPTTEVATDFLTTLWVRALFKDDPQTVAITDFPALMRLHDKPSKSRTES
jgi:AcrR family transcriptional regulator